MADKQIKDFPAQAWALTDKLLKQNAADTTGQNTVANLPLGDIAGLTGDIVGTSDTQTLTGKTIDADNNTLSNLAHGAEVDNPSNGVHGVTGDIVGTSDTQTLTGKTIDANNNTVSNLAHGAEVDNPSSGVHGVTGDVVGTSDTQVLTNKTIATADNTITSASDSATGVVELATTAEVAAGTDTGRVITPAGLAAVFQYDTIWVGAGAMTPCTTNGCAALATNEYGTNDIDLDYLAFDGGATEERAQFSLAMPEGWDRGTIKAKVFWSSAASSTAGDTVEWGIKAGAISDNDAIDAALGTAQVISDTLLADNGGDLQVTSATPALTVGGTPALGDLVLFEIYRNTDGTDDMAEDAWLFGILIQYKKTNEISAW